MFPLLLLLLAQTPAANPDPTAPPANTVAVATAEGRGVQIYHCAAKDGAFQWIFDAPEATLYQPSTDVRLGSHAAGPSWTWKDGSSITGTVIAKAPAPQSGPIPWLLLKTHPVVSTAGVLGPVTWVRRSETAGGNPPSPGCDPQRDSAGLRVPYKATYIFYRQIETATPQ